MVAEIFFFFCSTLTGSPIAAEAWQTGAAVGGAPGVGAASALLDVAGVGAFFAGVHGSRVR